MDAQRRVHGPRCKVQGEGCKTHGARGNGIQMDQVLGLSPCTFLTRSFGP
jgi:hypothetical protein